MSRLRVVAAGTLTVGMLVLGASAAYAWVDVTAMVLSEYPVDRGRALITVGVNCVDHETFEPTIAEATVTVTLTQGNRSVTKTETFTCNGDQPDAVTFTFRGFHAGSASVGMTVTACDAQACDTSSFKDPVAVTLVR
jgi:hypothetical protein